MHECKSYLQCFDYEASSVSLIADPGFPIDFAHMYSACLAFAEVTLVSYRTVQTAYSKPYNPSATTQGHAWVWSWVLTDCKIKMREGYGEPMHVCNQRLFHCRYTIYSCSGWGQYNMRYNLTRLQIKVCFLSAVLFLRPACGTGI